MSSASTSTQQNTLRHALNVVERLQSQLSELSSDNANLESRLHASEKEKAGYQDERRSLKTQNAALEAEISTATGALSAIRREQAAEREKFEGDAAALRRGLLQAAETERSLREKIVRSPPPTTPPPQSFHP
jgi:predicted  nucleic acid-binding Zn-ribbon protein